MEIVQHRFRRYMCTLINYFIYFFFSIDKVLKPFQKLENVIQILFEGKFSIEFFNLRYKYKKFYEFSNTKLLVNFLNFDIFCKHLNFKNL